MGPLISEPASNKAPVDQEAPESVASAAPPGDLRRIWIIGAIVAMIAAFTVPPIAGWQRMSEDRALSLSNVRRLGQGTLMYAQDWDSNTMPPPRQVSQEVWVCWPKLLKPYVSPESTFSNPSNSIVPFHSSLRDPIADYAVDSSYAINRRLWNTFAKGPFPLDNLEMPEQTVLLLEAGRMWQDPIRRPKEARNIGLLDYGDTTDRYGGLVPYPSTHDGRMAVVAADGHGLMLTVQHYTNVDGLHDPMYGRIGSGIYNWNGGHPNGETDRPPKE